MNIYLLFRAYRDRLPFLLIFGVATTVDVIHYSLPHGTTSKMAINSFASAPSIHLLANFVEALVMDVNVPFKLGGRVLKTLLETFSFMTRLRGNCRIQTRKVHTSNGRNYAQFWIIRNIIYLL